MKRGVKWCFGLKGGLKMVKPSDELARSYLEEAKMSIKRADKDFKDGDLLWSSVVTYYAEYYAIYSFLQKIGVKCENHFCTIAAVGALLGEEKVALIKEHRKRRVDAQYYMRTGKENEVKAMLRDSRSFVSAMDETVSLLTGEEIENYRKKLRMK